MTETTPYEVPIIFSNEGFYDNVRNENALKTNPIFKQLFEKILHTQPAEPKATAPFFYKIRKNSDSFRVLALPHPHTELRVRDFYSKYDRLICYYTSLSPVSIRAPLKPAKRYYYGNSWDDIQKYKVEDEISPQSEDDIAKHSPSYFAYSGFSRLHKFFDSNEYLRLEESFPFLKSLDVSKCFDSIYTHSIAWALKDKPFIKRNLKSGKKSFGHEFDQLLQKANNNETNGILIGPEISRIFAEIIFQDIDLRTLRLARDRHNLEHGQDYAIRRYVDDVYIFAKNEHQSRILYNIYCQHLEMYNLKDNSLKSFGIWRPFVTNRSRVVHDVNRAIDHYTKGFLRRSNSNPRALLPLKVHRRQSMTDSFVKQIKATCSYNETMYEEVAPYVNSAMFQRLKSLVNNDLRGASAETIENYKNACIAILDASFFFYNVAPTVNGSYKLAASSILAARFADRYLRNREKEVKSFIFERTRIFLESDSFKDQQGLDNFVLIEGLNAILSISELENEFVIDERVLLNAFKERKKLSYFEIITLLFYVGNREGMNEIKDLTMAKIDDIITNAEKSAVFNDSEVAHLALDVFSCPYIERKKKTKWARRIGAHILGKRPTKPDIDDFINTAERLVWFVNWGSTDLLNSLEKKELKKTY
ncbi:antiviral reverse transcriptase Drt3b [Arhodomonas aquaeolei]|uniref:antiviral reverse transcriptase Drt3b n=1 Tax=Arhodomonas aquaeolei TaxID=2369 RepID=UPI0012EC72C5|nr:antiviral reverse transcriptase Drt3b [Arhodomonas aquaeolei]